MRRLVALTVVVCAPGRGSRLASGVIYRGGGGIDLDGGGMDDLVLQGQIV